MSKYTLYNGKCKFPSALSREAYVLISNIRDLDYCLENNKDGISKGDFDIMKSVLKSMVKSHKRMVAEMVKTGDYIGNPKEIEYGWNTTKK